jgi:uncharacterized membrane protein YhaH (DUF805 family)
MNSDEDKLSAGSFLVTLFFPKRIGRGSYFIRHCVIGPLFWGILGSGLFQESEVTGWILLLLCSTYEILWVVLPRMRDLSIRAFWLILVFVPVVDGIFGLILLFRPSALALVRLSALSVPPPISGLKA